MITPMQEVFAHLRASKDSNGFGEAYCVDWLLEMEKEILEKEEETIKKCIVMGMEFIPVDPSRCEEDSELIFNETFNTKER